MTHDSGAQGFLPFVQTGGERIARPVPACDYQGIVADPEVEWDMQEILRNLNLVAWDFETLIHVASTHPPLVTARSRSSRVVLGGGYEQYAGEQKQAGKSGRNLKEHRRRLQRSRGPVRFVAQATDLSVLSALTQWKAVRFKGFADWARRTMELIHAASADDFSGILSALYAGDSLVAAHFGVRCDGVLHYWFPGFNPEFSRYSAGQLLMEDLIAQLPSLQCHTLDLGPGGELYKDYFANASIEVLSGHYENPALLTYARKLRRVLRDFVRTRPLLNDAARPLIRLLRRPSGRDRSN